MIYKKFDEFIQNLLTICLLVSRYKGAGMHLTKSVIDKIEYTDKDVFYWDDTLKGFGLKVTKKSKNYIVQSRVNGKTVRKNIGSSTLFTPDEARKEAKKLLGEMAKGIDINAQEKKNKFLNITLAQAYIDYRKIRNLGEKTLIDYDRAMETTFKDWKNKAVATIDRDMIERKFKEYSKQAPALANLHFRFLRALLNFAMEKYSFNGEPLIPSNPCNRLTILKLWNRIERRDTFIKPAQIRSFFYGLNTSDSDKELVKIAKRQCLFILFTGCREQEAARLQRKDIDLQERTVTFQHTKNHRRYILPMGDWLFSFVNDLCGGLAADDYLFPANNKSGHIKDHRRLIKQISEDCSVQFTLHDIRRTFASIVDHHLGQKFTPYTIKRLLNHSQGDVTAGYIRFGIDDLRRPMQMIEDFILEQAGIQQRTNNEKIIKFENRKEA